MKKALLLLLASVVFVGGGIFAAGAHRASAIIDDGGYIFIVRSSLAPQSQTQEIRGVAPLQAIVTLEECADKGSPVSAPEPTSDNIVCASSPTTASASPSDYNWLITGGIAGRLVGDSGPDAGQVIDFGFSNAIVNVVQNGNVIVITISTVVPWPNTAGRPGDDMVHFELRELSKPVGAASPRLRISNQVEVHWIKTGGIDPSMFVRRTPVVEQVAAPAAPEVQAPATGTGRITAPNTGDAGLQARSGASDALLPVGTVLLLGGMLGGTLLYRRLLLSRR